MPNKLLLVFFLFSSNMCISQFSRQLPISNYAFQPRDAKLIDLDNDNDLDIICGSSSGNYKLAWIENLGGGVYSNERVFEDSTFTFPWEINAADLDGDGDLDIYASFDWYVRWYENKNGNFLTAQIINTPSGNRCIEAADIDNDNDLDLVYAVFNGSSDLVWIENSGNGTFGATHVIDYTQGGACSMRTRDLDNDGDIDVLLGGNSRVYWYENLGGGSFGPEILITNNTIWETKIWADDLDNDGDLDVISASYNDDKIAWYENLGAGVIDTTQNVISLNADDARFVYASDINGDGYKDILSASSADNKIAWYENINGTSFGGEQIIQQLSYASQATHVYAGDVDNDGDEDVLSVSWSGTIAWHENNGIGNFILNHAITPNNRGLFGACAGDINGDGYLDVLAASSTDKKLYWYENLRYGSFASPTLISSIDAFSAIFAKDMDGDLDIDIIAKGAKGIVWYENLGAGNIDTLSKLITSFQGFTYILTEDIDVDGDVDIVAANPSSAKYDWFENLGGGNIDTNRQLLFNSGTPGRFNVLDIDNDGDMDVQWVTSTNGIKSLENTGSGYISRPNVGTAKYHVINASDLDNDGDLDYLSSGSLPNYDGIVWYENLGNFNFGSEQIISTNVDRLSAIFTEDADGDGDVDIFTASTDDKILAYYENLGGGNFGNQIVVSQDVYQSPNLFGGDLDSDNDLDIILSSVQDDKLCWFENFYNVVNCSVSSDYIYVDNGGGNFTFTNTSAGFYTASDWAFGDGNNSTVNNPNHTFSSNGTFPVILTVNDSTLGESCRDFFIDTLTVTGVSSSPPCLAGFVMYPDTTPYSNIILVQNSSVGTNLAYHWDFGDGDTSSLVNPSHRYLSNGPFWLCLTIDDGNNCIDTYCDSIGYYGVLFKQLGFSINIIGPSVVTSTELNNSYSKFKLWPNPTHNKLYIESGLNINKIEVLDVLGNKVFDISKDNKYINVSDLSDGVYFIRIYSDQGMYTERFIKQ